MKKLVHNNAKTVITIIVTFLGICIIGSVLHYGKEQPSNTADFINQHMRNANGTLATYLQDAQTTDPNIVAGREALSESQGLWMHYAVMQHDQQTFDESLQLLTTYFLTPQKYIQWKLRPTGHSEVSTNALGDDLRIIDSLLKAYAVWNDEKYLNLAKEISSTLQTEGKQNGYFVDFHDFKRNESSQTLSLVYVDLSALKKMKANHLITSNEYDQYENLLLHMPNDGVFYPKSFDVYSKQYTYDESVNLIDQLIVGIHMAEAGQQPTPLIQFLKSEFEKRHQLMGRYNRQTREPDVSYESPGVYGLAILLALKGDDVQWAKQLEDQMLKLRDQDSAYKGGYVFDNNTHIFDNLFPLLAETTLNND